jgi:hypothetical protein
MSNMFRFSKRVVVNGTVGQFRLTTISRFFIEVVCQRQGNTMAQLLYGYFVISIENDASVSFVFEFVSKYFLEGIDQRGLAVKIHGVPTNLGFYPVDPDGASTFRFRRNIAGLPPLKSLVQLPDPVRGQRRIENQSAEKQQFFPGFLGIRLKDRGDRRVLEFLLFLARTSRSFAHYSFRNADVRF